MQFKFLILVPGLVGPKAGCSYFERCVRISSDLFAINLSQAV